MVKVNVKQVIGLNPAVKKRLDALKVHAREPYSDVVEKVLNDREGLEPAYSKTRDEPIPPMEDRYEQEYAKPITEDRLKGAIDTVNANSTSLEETPYVDSNSEPESELTDGDVADDCDSVPEMDVAEDELPAELPTESKSDVESVPPLKEEPMNVVDATIPEEDDDMILTEEEINNPEV